jgi:hypothetical protein
MTVHIELNGAYTVCDTGACELKFHFPGMAVEEVKQVPLSALLPLVEAIDPPHAVLRLAFGFQKRWVEPAPPGSNSAKPVTHRDYGLPAITWDDGTMGWYQHGKRHRNHDLPAVIHAGGSRHWYQHGVLHRGNGQPAVIASNGEMQYWVNGVRVDEEGGCCDRQHDPPHAGWQLG